MNWLGPRHSLQRYLTLAGLGPIIALNLWVWHQLFLYFEYLLSVLIIAAILAYLLNGLAAWLQRFSLTRLQAMIMVLGFVLIIFTVVGFTLIPAIATQSQQLIERLPEIVNSGNDSLQGVIAFGHRFRFPFNFEQITEELLNQLKVILSVLPDLAFTTLGRFVDALLVLVLTVYMLFYGGQLWGALVSSIPQPWGPIIDQSLRLNIQKFFSAQLVLGLFMFLALLPVMIYLGVNFSLLFALIIGLAQLIPVIGATVGIGLVVLVVLFQDVWLAVNVLVIAVFFQQIKDNILAPRLLGNIIGLNPLWQFIALLIGGRVAGLLGVFLSIPIAATIKATIEKIRELEADSLEKTTP
ncbi:AI-2E family transporter [Synechococcus sp. PCC 6312]|uniref:AI-2E family transporter n=1 Tax=Synechococcus sp. (strain ATCC 27167 / PCC 6312) TaxID=195253 RepID=UPI00029F01BF|nr:AI-2E family transporter [Synechococcus sp. PCC 6312]AFY60623.1 putative permease [Synechococcus sp. PCC 6312]